MTTEIGQHWDILAVGELLVDLIGTEFTDDFGQVQHFKKLQGGSPANLAANMARLGNRTKLIASVGKGTMGSYLINTIKAMQVDTSDIKRTDLPSTLILVSRSKETADFEPYRAADYHIDTNQFPVGLLQQIRLFHTTCFALSKRPAQTVILEMARQAAQAGVQLSIDLNYASKIWPDREEAHAIVHEYCSLGALIKISEVDWERLYGSTSGDPADHIDHMLELGAAEVCLTLGSEGCMLGNKEGKSFLEARRVEVKDTTGAGDAFWAGYLTAWLDGHSLLERAMAGRKMAELKISRFDVLPQQIDRSEIYIDF